MKGCSAHARIDLRYHHRYQDLLGKQQRRRSGNLEAKQHTTKRIRAENNDGATTYSVTHHPKKKRNSPISSLSSPPLADGTDQSVCPPEDSNVLSEITQEVIPAVTHSLPSPTDAKPPPIQTSIANYVTRQPTAKTTKQQVLGPNLDVFLPSAEEKLNFAIANMIHSEALPFKFSESPHLAEVIKLAKHVPYTYKPISRKSCSGRYLQINHQKYKERSFVNLMIDSNIFGLSLSSDGATVIKKPLLNILINGIHCRVYVASVKDCTEVLKQGKTKSGPYIFDLLVVQMDIIDPQKKLFDCVFTDGGSNFVNAGKQLLQKYPRLTLIHGCEHVIHLFVKDLMFLAPIKALIIKCCNLHNIFGGCRHMPYALFQSQIKKHFPGRKLGLLKHAATRMGGIFYEFHRVLKLKIALQATVSDSAWKDCLQSDKKSRQVKVLAESIVHDQDFFHALFVVVKCLFPVIKCLRLSDTNKPGMDKIVYFLHQSKCMIRRMKHLFDEDRFTKQFTPSMNLAPELD